MKLKGGLLKRTTEERGGSGVAGSLKKGLKFAEEGLQFAEEGLQFAEKGLKFAEEGAAALQRRA